MKKYTLNIILNALIEVVASKGDREENTTLIVGLPQAKVSENKKPV